MSRNRQAPPAPERAEESILVRTWATTHQSGAVVSKRSYEWDQLAYASQGVMSVHTDQGMWVVPPHRAVWIPAGETYHLEMSGRVAVRTLFFKAGISRSVPARCQAVNVSPLLRELVLETIRQGMLHRGVPSQERLARVILDQLETLPAVPLQLPMPRDPRARRAADLLCQDPGEPRSLSLAARSTGASKRTLERLFRSETQMTLGRWRQRLRLIEALRSLASGEDVTRVALHIGYNSPSAFIAAFRREMGTTPGRYFEPAA